MGQLMTSSGYPGNRKHFSRLSKELVLTYVLLVCKTRQINNTCYKQDGCRVHALPQNARAEG